VDATVIAVGFFFSAVPAIVFVAGRFLIPPPSRTPYETLIEQIHADADDRRPLLATHPAEDEPGPDAADDHIEAARLGAHPPAPPGPSPTARAASERPAIPVPARR
jgi:hypothetical protein